MKIGRYKQTPDERKRYVIDYSQWLDDGETLTGGINITVDHTVAAPLVVDGTSVDDTNTELIMFVSGGDNGETYRVDIIVQTNGGQYKEDFLFFDIVAPDPNTVITVPITAEQQTLLALEAILSNLPTSKPLSSNKLWKNGGFICIT